MLSQPPPSIVNLYQCPGAPPNFQGRNEAVAPGIVNRQKKEAPDFRRVTIHYPVLLLTYKREELAQRFPLPPFTYSLDILVV